MQDDILQECELAATEAELTLRELEAAADAVLARLPPERLLRLGMLCNHPEVVEERMGLEAGDWLDAIGPVVSRRLQGLGPDRVARDYRTRALIGALQEGLAVRAQP